MSKGISLSLHALHCPFITNAPTCFAHIPPLGSQIFAITARDPSFLPPFYSYPFISPPIPCQLHQSRLLSAPLRFFFSFFVLANFEGRYKSPPLLLDFFLEKLEECVKRILPSCSSDHQIRDVSDATTSLLLFTAHLTPIRLDTFATPVHILFSTRLWRTNF